MSHTHRKLLPIGSNMNDAAYPFRGEHRLESCINHGHSGVGRKICTSFGMRITGSNLVIEQVQAPKGVSLACELGVNGGIPRPVSLQQAAAFMVPGDGRDYNLIATVKANGADAKHYSRLTFNGSEGNSVLHMRAPDHCNPNTVYIIADGHRLHPKSGWFRIPFRAKDCALVVNLLKDAAGSSLHSTSLPEEATSRQMRSPSRQRHLGSCDGNHSSDDGAGDGTSGRRPEESFFFLETVREAAGIPTQAPLLVSTSTGEIIPLAFHETVAVPFAGSPFRLQLPPLPNTAGDSFGQAASSPPESSSNAVQPVELETRIEPPSSVVDRDTTSAVTFSSTMPLFVATAPNFSLQLISEDGSSASGFGTAACPLRHRQAQTMQIIVTDAQGRVVLRQKSRVPALEPPASTLRLNDNGSGGLTVSASPGSKLSVGGIPQADPAMAVPLPRIVAQQVVVEQPNPDGTLSKALLDVSPASRVAGAAGSTPGGVAPLPVPINAGVGQPPPPTPASLPEKWVTELCDALQKTDPEEQRRLLQAIHPSSIPGMTIVNFVRDQLTRRPPPITFAVSPTGLQSVQCPGCTVTATVGNDPAQPIPAFGSLPLAMGKTVLLSATSLSTRREVSACQMQMAASASTPTGSAYSPYGVAASPVPGGAGDDGKADSDLVHRLVDCLLHNNVSAPQVANELGEMSTTAFSAQGRRLLPLLTSCLRNAVASGAAAAAAQAASTQAAAAAAVSPPQEEIFLTCGPGYVTNVYTTHPQYDLFAAVDNQAPERLLQRGRVPAQGTLEGAQKPYFVRITAKDPVTGAVRGERVVTLLGVSTDTAAAATTPQQSGSGAASSPTPTNAGVDGTAPVRPGGGGLDTPMPYLDVSIQAVSQDAHVRFLCPPHLRIVCDVDGVGGDTGKSDFVAKMTASRSHHMNVSLVNAFGKLVFQQKLDFPAMISPLWGLAVQHNGLSVDPETGTIATASIDRSPECAMQGNLVSFDGTVPHFIQLRKYLNGIHGSCAGEVLLRLPGLSLPPELEELTRILRRRASGQSTEPQTQAELRQLRSQCTSPLVADLIDSIMALWPLKGLRSSGLGQESVANRVFFRLTGTD